MTLNLAPIESILDAAQRSGRQSTSEALLDLSDSFNSIELTIYVLGSIALIATAVIAYLLSNSITHRLSKLDELAQRVAKAI